MLRTLSICGAISRVTFSEILRDKVLYGALVICALLLGFGALLSRVSFVKPDRILLDYGLLALAVTSGFLATLAGAVVLLREFERRTVFIALARPISRLEFVVGKFLGVAGVLFLNAVVLSLGFLGILKFFAVDGGLFSPTLFEALFLLPLQACVLAALALFFASFSTPSLSILMTLGLYLVGVNLSHLRFLAQKAQDPVERAVLETLALVLPNFEHFNWGLRVSYGLPVPATYLATALSYAFIWIALLLMGAGMCLEGREN